ncbi:MAG: hypothetical protein KGQ60_00690 [Planctomycetes bacterium]|nr:hypothetical protein [Planctomycetota bacterium]
MQKRSPAWPPMTSAEWIAGQQHSTDIETCHREAVQVLETLAVRLVEMVCGSKQPGERDLDSYLARLWSCIESHWQRLSEIAPIRMETLLERLQQGDLGYARIQGNVLRDVVLSQALELKESQAATMFIEEYMPTIREIAFRAGGERATNDIDNFAATLILPRGDRPCRIAQYQGRTTLAHWLRAVVVNECVSRSRGKHARNIESLPEQEIIEDISSRLDESPCEGLLRPLFVGATAALSTEDRLLIKMLVLDNVPQKALAASIGINSGNVTRRRQKVTTAIWQRVRTLAIESGQGQRTDECLELVLAGPNLELRRRLGQVLAAALDADATNVTEVDQK